MNLQQYFSVAREEKWALPHFNFATAEQLKAIILGFRDVVDDGGDHYALMLGTSEGEAKFVGYRQARALVDAWKKETGLPLFLNADHHKSSGAAMDAIDAGYDTVLIDTSKLDFEKNVAETKRVVEYAREHPLEHDSHVMMVEGELGYLRGESQVQKTVEISPEDFTKPEEAAEFVKQTGVERLAIAVGNNHGIMTEQKKGVDVDLIRRIQMAVPQTHLVLHGGSGLTDDDFRKAIDAGITNVHINTEVRIAYRKGIEMAFSKEPEQTTPSKFLDDAVEEMRKVVAGRVKVFLGL